jgi:hypothetical protein
MRIGIQNTDWAYVGARLANEDHLRFNYRCKNSITKT